MKYKLLFGLLLALASLNVEACDPYALFVCKSNLATCAANTNAASAAFGMLNGFSSGCCLGCAAGAVCTCVAIGYTNANNANAAQAPEPVAMNREEGVDNNSADDDSQRDSEQRLDGQLSRRVGAAAVGRETADR